MNEERDEPIEGSATEQGDGAAVGENATGAPPGGPMTSSPPGTELMPTPPPTPATVAVKPRVGADDLVERLEVIQRAQEQAMKDGVDFGVIPGTEKPTLLKPGAEKLSVLFELDVQIVNEKLWEPPHLTVISKAVVYHAPSGARLGYGEGICTTHEKKYAKRMANRKCPDCDAEAILLSRDASEGWFCWRKKGGCGNKFPRDDERITRQEVGEIENPNLPDTWNTVVKIAQKRARVDAVLAVTGASALFTQDAEDLEPGDRAGKSSEEMKTKRGKSGNGSKGGGDKPTSAQKGAVTKLLNAKIPTAELRKTLRESVPETKLAYGRLVGNLKKVADDGSNLVAFFKAHGITYAPPSDTPGDTSDLDAAEREEAEAMRHAGEEGSLFPDGGSDDES